MRATGSWAETKRHSRRGDRLGWANQSRHSRLRPGRRARFRLMGELAHVVDELVVTQQRALAAIAKWDERDDVDAVGLPV
jgi:hypothetical protein